MAKKTEEEKRQARKEKREKSLKTKQEYMEKRHSDRVRYAYFSRYLMVRYFVVFLFMINVFWVALNYYSNIQIGMWLSVITTIFALVATFEQLGKLYNKDLDVPRTRYYLWYQIILNAFLIISLFTPFRKTIFPYITNQAAVYVMIAFLIIGIIMAASCEVRIHNIRIGKDKYAKFIKNAENSKALDDYAG